MSPLLGLAGVQSAMIETFQFDAGNEEKDEESRVLSSGVQKIAKNGAPKQVAFLPIVIGSGLRGGLPRMAVT